MKDSQPLVPATVSLPEITVKAVVLSIILAAVLAAANAYLGLFAGMTVSEARRLKELEAENTRRPPAFSSRLI